jgi:hypothetical protein
MSERTTTSQVTKKIIKETTIIYYPGKKKMVSEWVTKSQVKAPRPAPKSKKPSTKPTKITRKKTGTPNLKRKRSSASAVTTPKRPKRARIKKPTKKTTPKRTPRKSPARKKQPRGNSKNKK